MGTFAPPQREKICYNVLCQSGTFDLWQRQNRPNLQLQRPRKKQPKTVNEKVAVHLVSHLLQEVRRRPHQVLPLL